MKKYLNWLPVVFLVGAVAAYQFFSPFRTLTDGFLYQSPCDSPMTYALGSIDPRFNLSKEQLQQDVTQATEIWGGAYGKNLFALDPTSKFKINLVFDERQGLSNEIGSLENNLSDKQKEMKPAIAQYQNDAADFQKRVAALNTEISNWNAKGGAPKDVYDRLIKDQQDLKAESNSLNLRAKNLNQSATQFNEQVGSLNQTIGTFNNTLLDKPEEGLFDPNNQKIDIFFNTNREELVHTLAHEFGHALGMLHVEDAASIMFSRSNRNTDLTVNDRKELAHVCKKIPVWEVWSKRLAKYLKDNLRDWQLETSKGA